MNKIDVFSKVNCFEKYRNIKSFLLFGDESYHKNIKVSIIIPTYKRNDYFVEAIQSAINQDYNGPFEIIVVDNNPYDGNKDEQQLYIESLCDGKILYYRNEKNIGMLGNWNRAIELSNGEYFTFCHDDDRLKKNCLKRLMDLQSKYQDKLIVSAYDSINGNSEKIISTLKESSHSLKIIKRYLMKKDCYSLTDFDLFLSNPGFVGGALFKKKYTFDIGGFNEEYYPSADYALFMSYTHYYGCVFNAVPVFDYRIAVNESSNVFNEFANVDYSFRMGIIREINYPKLLCVIIAKANYLYGKRNFYECWGNVDNLPKKVIWANLCIKFLHACRNLRHYSIHVVNQN